MKRLLRSAALAVLLLAGCTSFPTDRIAANQALFASWPQEIQAKVRAGQVAVGFTMDQVMMALGAPTIKTQATGPEGVTDVWAYNHIAPRLGIGVGVGTSNGSTAVGGSAANTIKLGLDVSGRVVFTNKIATDVLILSH